VTDLLEAILNVLAAHFEQSEALPIIGSFGNRFEGWFQWECVVGLRRAQVQGALPEVADIVLEAEHDYDLLLRGKSGVSDDVRLELKARSTKGQGSSELGSAMIYDQAKLDAAVRSYGGRAASLALIIAAPGGAIDKWVSEIQAHKWLTMVRGSAPNSQTRKIIHPGATSPVAALMLFPV
jgi:hypothetical protein